MPTTAPQFTHAAPQSVTPRRIAPPPGGAAVPHSPTWGDVIDERLPMIGAPAFFGPPVIFVLGPWLLLVLVLVGPFVLMLTVLLGMAVAAGLLALLVGVIASPYLLVRRLRAHGRFQARPLTPVHLFKKQRASFGRLGSIQPKGVS